MADFIHTHGAPKCKIGKNNPACPQKGWSWVCGPKKCIHLDPSIKGAARTVKVLRALGYKVNKGRKPAKRR